MSDDVVVSILVRDDEPTVAAFVETVPVVSTVIQSGPPGPPGAWVAMTQAEYDALDPKDPATLYVING